MSIFIIVVLLIGDAGLFYFIWNLHKKLEKLNQNQAIMIEWFETIRKNEETLQETLKKLYRGFHASEKESKQNGRIAQAKESIRPR
jgi:hypothetical protein